MARHFQFRLRTIFILIALVAMACAAGPWIWRRIWYSEIGHMTVIVVEDDGTHTRYKEIWWCDGTKIVTERVRTSN